MSKAITYGSSIQEQNSADREFNLMLKTFLNDATTPAAKQLRKNLSDSLVPVYITSMELKKNKQDPDVGAIFDLVSVRNKERQCFRGECSADGSKLLRLWKIDENALSKESKEQLSTPLENTSIRPGI